MSRVFGEARDFYRVRMIRVDAQDDFDLEWRDDILWRRPPHEEQGESVSYRIDAVRLDDESNVTVIALFDDHEEASEWLAQVQADLDEMTRSEFEAAYVDGGAVQLD